MDAEMLLRKKLEERRRALESTLESSTGVDEENGSQCSMVRELGEWRSEAKMRTALLFSSTKATSSVDVSSESSHLNVTGQDMEADVHPDGDLGTTSPQGTDIEEAAMKMRRKIRERLRRTRVSSTAPPTSSKVESPPTNRRRPATLQVAPSVEEAYQFFTSNHHSQPDETEMFQQETETISDETKLLIGDVLDMGNGLLEASKFVSALYRPQSERLQLEHEALFQTSSAQVPLLQKLAEDVQPRDLEDEGFYVGARPHLPQKVRNKIEQRLIKNKSVHWFAEDGGILALPDPRVMTSSGGKFELDGHGQSEMDTVPVTVFKKARCGLVNSQEVWETCQKHFQLDFNVLRISFTHHPLFSKEHVIASRLNQLLEQHAAAQSRRLWEHLTDRLVALRVAVSNIKDILDKREQVSSDKEKRLTAYKAEIRQLREQKYLVGLEGVKLQKAILNCWRKLKSFRQKQGYSNTEIKLRIFREEADLSADEKQFHEDFETELNELREEFEDKYRNEVRTQEAQDGARVFPELFDVNSVAERLRERMLESRRLPGEPLLLFELLTSNPVTPSEQCPKNEQRRRQAVQRAQIFLKIIFNGKPLDTNVTRTLTSNFSVSVNEVFHLKIYQRPQSLSVQLFESESLHPSEMLAQMFIPIPSSKRTLHHVHQDTLEFSGDNIKSFSHEGVGSGVSVDFDEIEDNKQSQLLMTSGTLKYSASWAVDQDGNVLSPPNIRSNIISTSIQNKNYTSSVDKITQWLDEGNLDPNDPRNAEMISQLKISTQGVSKLDHFRLNPLQRAFDFVEDDAINFNKRFKMIALRAGDVPEFVGLRIPLRERDVPSDVFDAYEKRLRDDANAQKDRDDGVDTAWMKGAFALKRLKQVVMDQCRLAEQHKTLEEVVLEEQVLDIGTLGLTLAQLTKKRRPLRPERRERRKLTSLSLGITRVNLLVNVACAFNVPVRTNSELGLAHDGSNFNEPCVRPFVEVVFQRQTARTSVSHGPSPRWNHDMQLEFRPPEGSFLPDNLQNVRDTLYLHLMDEVVVDLIEDDRERESFVHQRLDRRWLGSLCIPFSTIYLNTRLSGTFRMSSPPILLGYEREGRALGQGPTGTSTDPFNMHSDKDHTYISIFVTLEPTLPLPEPITLKLASIESERTLREVDSWRSNLQLRFPCRDVRVLVTESTGKTVLVTRFIRPFAPPDALISTFSGMSSRQIMELLARFVSLIPTEADAMKMPGNLEIWVPSNQFLEMLVGGPEEHAVLLCNFFLYLGKKSYVLLGSAVPEGKTAHCVVFEDGGQFTLWNASTGTHFLFTDALNPLTRVDCLFNQDNIWFNVQPHVTTPQMSFDIDSAKFWLPFHTKSFPNPGLPSIQPDVLEFSKPDEHLAQRVSENVEQTLRSQLMLWRRHLRTVWNRHCSRILKSILPKLEKSRYGAVVKDELTSDLQSIRTSYKLCGFPMDLAYVNLESVVDAVFSTGVHHAEGEDVEFALAVHAHSYPANVMAIWVYIASLSKK